MQQRINALWGPKGPSPRKLKTQTPWSPTSSSSPLPEVSAAPPPAQVTAPAAVAAAAIAPPSPLSAQLATAPSAAAPLTVAPLTVAPPAAVPLVSPVTPHALPGGLAAALPVSKWVDMAGILVRVPGSVECKCLALWRRSACSAGLPSSRMSAATACKHHT